MALAEGFPRSIFPDEMGRAVYRSPETVLAFGLMKSGQDHDLLSGCYWPSLIIYNKMK